MRGRKYRKSVCLVSCFVYGKGFLGVWYIYILYRQSVYLLCKWIQIVFRPVEALAFECPMRSDEVGFMMLFVCGIGFLLGMWGGVNFYIKICKSCFFCLWWRVCDGYVFWCVWCLLVCSWCVWYSLCCVFCMVSVFSLCISPWLLRSLLYPTKSGGYIFTYYFFIVKRESQGGVGILLYIYVNIFLYYVYVWMYIYIILCIYLYVKKNMYLFILISIGYYFFFTFFYINLLIPP